MPARSAISRANTVCRSSRWKALPRPIPTRSASSARRTRATPLPASTGLRSKPLSCQAAISRRWRRSTAGSANSGSRSSRPTRPRYGRCCAGSTAPTFFPAWDGYWNDALPHSINSLSPTGGEGWGEGAKARASTGRADPHPPAAARPVPPLPRCGRGFRVLCDRALRSIGLSEEHLDRLLQGFELALFGLQLLQLLGMPGQHLCAPRADLILHALDVARF